MRIQTLVLFLACTTLLSAQLATPSERDNLRHIHFYLADKTDWKIRSSDEARRALIGGFAKLGAKGISADWGWSVRDAIVAPKDIDGLATKGDVIWIGQYTSIDSLYPFAFAFLNARTGIMDVIGELPSK